MSYVSTQPFTFFACLGVGAASAFWYAFLWIIRKAYDKKIVTLICDFLFVAASVGGYFLCLFSTNSGEFRLFSLVAFVLGFAIISALLSFLKPKGEQLLLKLEKESEKIKRIFKKKKDVKH